MPRRTDATDGASPRRKPHTVPAPHRPTHSSRAAVDHDGEVPQQQRAGFGSLLRGPGAVLGGLSGIDGAGRSLDRLSRAADRGAAFLERMEDRSRRWSPTCTSTSCHRRPPRRAAGASRASAR